MLTYFASRKKSGLLLWTTMAKNKAVKPPKSRPASTSALAQPHQYSSFEANLTAFSADASLFAQLSQAVDRGRLRVYTASPAAMMADYLLPEGAQCRALAWVPLAAAAPAEAVASKKRKAHAKATQAAAAPPAQLYVALGLSDGTVLLYSPHQDKVVRVLVGSSPDSTSAAMLSLSYSAREARLWGAASNGLVHAWDLATLAGATTERIPSVAQFTPDAKTPTSLLASEASALLTAHHAIALYDTAAEPPKEQMRFSGHATPLTHLVWATDAALLSAAEEDRYVYLWHTSSSGSGVRQAQAMITLDAPARRVHVWRAADETYALILSERGTAHIYRLPLEVRASKKGLATLDVLSKVTTAFDAHELVDAHVYADGQRIRFARAVKGVKMLLEDAVLADSDGALLPTIALAATSQRAATAAAHTTQRYKETEGSAGVRAELPLHAGNTAALLGSGGLLPDPSAAGADDHDRLLAEGELVDEPTLAQRLKALKVQRGEKSARADDDDDAEAHEPVVPVSGASLASSLTQALHSGDQALLTSCLVHSEPTLIRTTVRRISGPLAVRLLESCVDRLNRGGVKSKGALGSARARGIVEWMYQAMTCHTAYLMSLPDLVARLAQLHHSLAARLAAHQRLLALKGRLELVMSQIDMNMAYTAEEAPIQVQGQRGGKRASAAELERRQDASRAQQQGTTWTEPEDDEVEDIGLAGDESDEEMAVDDELEEIQGPSDDLDALSASEDEDEEPEDEPDYDSDDSDAEHSDQDSAPESEGSVSESDEEME